MSLLDYVRTSGRYHPFGAEVTFYPSGELFEQDGAELLNEARAWCEHWHLNASWIQRWAAYALLRWEVARACSRFDCGGDCATVNVDDAQALAVVLTDAVMMSIVEEQYPESFEVAVEDLDILDSGETLPPWQRPVVAALPGPHPAREAKEQFDERMDRAWDAAKQALEDEGVWLGGLRNLEVDCERLVRYQVLRHSASAILGGSRTDPSTLYHAVRKLADMIGLPLRSRS